MTKQEFIKNFNLTKTNTKAHFADGLASKSRTLYISNAGVLYVFYDNDLCAFKPYSKNEYKEGMKEIEGRLCGAYSWYH